MKQRYYSCLFFLSLIMTASLYGETMNADALSFDVRIENNKMLVTMSGEGLHDFIEGPYQWHAVVNDVSYDQLLNPRMNKNAEGAIMVTGTLGPIEVVQSWTVHPGDGRVEERIVFTNPTKESLQISDLRTGVLRKIDNANSSFRLYAVPFIRQANGGSYEYSMADLVRLSKSQTALNATAAPAWSPQAPLIDEE